MKQHIKYCTPVALEHPVPSSEPEQQQMLQQHIADHPAFIATENGTFYDHDNNEPVYEGSLINTINTLHGMMGNFVETLNKIKKEQETQRQLESRKKKFELLVKLLKQNDTTIDGNQAEQQQQQQNDTDSDEIYQSDSEDMDSDVIIEHSNDSDLDADDDESDAYSYAAATVGDVSDIYEITDSDDDDDDISTDADSDFTITSIYNNDTKITYAVPDSSTDEVTGSAASKIKQD